MTLLDPGGQRHQDWAQPLLYKAEGEDSRFHRRFRNVRLRRFIQEDRVQIDLPTSDEEKTSPMDRVTRLR